MNKYLIPTILACAFTIVGLVTLKDYGINWDAPVHMMRGAAFAQVYLTGKKSFELPQRLSPMIIHPGEIASRYYYIPEERWKPIGALPERPLYRSEFERQQEEVGRRFSFYESEMWNGEYFITFDEPHLPMIDILSAFSNRLFYQRLGILGDIESYQLVYVLIAALGIFLVTLFAWEITHSWVAALVSGLSLGLFPIYFAESHINMKDPAQAVFFLGAVFAFYHWVKENKLKWFLLFTLFVAFSLATKWNIMFLPFILIPWLFTIRKTEQFKRWFWPRRLIGMGIVLVIFSMLFMVAVWPTAWGNPIGKLVETVLYYAGIGIGINKLQPEGFIFAGFNFYPLISTIAQTPEIILN